MSAAGIKHRGARPVGLRRAQGRQPAPGVTLAPGARSHDAARWLLPDERAVVASEAEFPGAARP
jgi:hypothetical protein